jgi:hypothetical protein
MPPPAGKLLAANGTSVNATGPAVHNISYSSGLNNAVIVTGNEVWPKQIFGVEGTTFVTDGRGLMVTILL